MATRTESDPERSLIPAEVEAAAAIFDMLSTPIRLHLMWLLAHGDHDVGWLAGPRRRNRGRGEPAVG